MHDFVNIISSSFSPVEYVVYSFSFWMFAQMFKWMFECLYSGQNSYIIVIIILKYFISAI